MQAFHVDNQNQFMCSDEDKQMFLYSVIMITPHKGTETHYVLASSENSAKGMAECAMGCASYETPEDIYRLVTTFVTRLPFTVQGWGKHKF